MKAVEDVGQLLRRDADAGVFHREFGQSVTRTKLHADASAECVFERVGNQVENNLFPHVAVDVDRFGERGQSTL